MAPMLLAGWSAFAHAFHRRGSCPERAGRGNQADEEVTVDYAHFVKAVQERGGFESRDEADQAITATLATLGERLKGNETFHLAAQLPPDLADAISGRGLGEVFSIEEFYRRVAVREGSRYSDGAVREHARAVMATLASAVTPGEWDDVMAQLPEEYAELLQ